ncbi:Hypothetical predicted protein [Octopus vulgaris]|uniref:Uncharacterized protein n=1 Tax=Octopus vulgaris TaxID=6645 RepID=A0AA36AVE9_OCTVU|nr:Hypothetical predicted protein [Octopus vulgaris]
MFIDQLTTFSFINDIKKLRPPNRKCIDEHLSQVKEKSKLHKQYVNEEETVRQTLKDVYTERTEYTKLQSRTISDLKLLKSEIIQKNNTLSNLQSGLTYKNENKINEAIKNLERQLNCNNFTLREEKKIVAEIDSLKRSKKPLANYRAQKKEIDELRAQQTKKRKENDDYYHKIVHLRDKEEEKQKRLVFLQKSIKELHSEIETLEEQKRVLLADFKKQEKDYNVMKDIARKKKHKRTQPQEEEKTQHEKITNYIREETVASPNPNAKRIQHCNILINYLQQFTSFNAVLGSSPLPSPSEEFVSIPGPALEIKDDDGAKYVLLKKSNDTFFKEFSVNNRQNRKSRKGRKKTCNKPLAHSPEIFSLFESVNLPPTSNFCDIFSTIDKLQQLKNQLEKAGLQKDNCKENGSVTSDDICLSDSGYSADGSAVCDLSRQVSHRGSTDMISNPTSLLDINQMSDPSSKSTTVSSLEVESNEVEDEESSESDGNSSPLSLNKERLSLILDNVRRLSVEDTFDSTDFDSENQTNSDLK